MNSVKRIFFNKLQPYKKQFILNLLTMLTHFSNQAPMVYVFIDCCIFLFSYCKCLFLCNQILYLFNFQSNYKYTTL